MPLNPAGLAAEIQVALGQPGAPSKELIGEATAICSEIMKATVSFLPATINGVAPPSGGKMTMGMGIGGVVAEMAPPSLANEMKTKMLKPAVTPQLQAIATAIVTHVMTGPVNFALNTIQATCSNTVVSPGAVTGLASTGGKISGLAGPALAALMAPAFGGVISPQLMKKCDAITKHVMANSVTSFAAGQVVGACSAGGGPITLGAAAGGKIT